MMDEKIKKPTYDELLDKIRELEERVKGKENREYKSRLFGFIFGREENKEWTLSLYNAINGSSHTDPKDITINTIEDVVYLGMKNDPSLIVSEVVSLYYRTVEIYEHQSTINPNMPVREWIAPSIKCRQNLRSANFRRQGGGLRRSECYAD